MVGTIKMTLRRVPQMAKKWWMTKYVGTPVSLVSATAVHCVSSHPHDYAAAVAETTGC
jgi:hypothetical protein